MKTSPAQQKVLEKLKHTRRGKTSKELNCSYRTLIALERGGLIELTGTACAAYVAPSYRKLFNHFKVVGRSRCYPPNSFNDLL